MSATALQVLLSTADLAVDGTGKLTVISPAPGGGTTVAIGLPVTDLPIPSITGAIISVPQPGASCSQLQIRVTGNNFYDGFTTLIVNGQTMRSSGGPTDLVAFLPIGFTATRDIVVVASNSLGGTPISSDPFTLSSSATPQLALCVTPSPANIYSDSNFLLTFSASQVNSSTLPAITAWTLPSGITSTASLPFTLPAQGTRVLFKADSSVAAGTSPFPFTGTTSSATSTGQVSLTASAITPPSFFILNPYVGELAISPGGSGTLSFNTSVNSSGGSDYTVTLAVSGLPQGTTASVSPSRIVAGESFTVTVTAAADAPLAQNVQVTVTGTPEAAVTPASNNFLLDVAPKPGTGVNNRTAFVSTAGTPSSVVYDRQLDLIFASVPSWNRVYVISNKTHAIERTIPVPGVQTMDVTQDGSVVWIGTNSRQVYALNTQTFGLTRYMVPQIAGGTWEANQILALSDGTIMLGTSPSAETGIYNNTVWNPATNQTHELIGEEYLLRRSGDGSKVYGTYYSSGYTNYLYTVATQTFTPLPLLGQGYALAAVNRDGSLLVGTDNKVYDGSAHLIGRLPAYLGTAYDATYGATVFSSDNATLFQIGTGLVGVVIATFDVPTLTLKGVAPALATLPNGVSETLVTNANPTADDSGMLIGIQTFGVGFDDSTFFQHYGANLPSFSPPVALTPRAGPLKGGTASTPYGFFELTPDVWYGSNRGSAIVDATHTLTVTSPTGEADGPVDVKYIYPNGSQVFTPQAFSYSVYPQYSVLSGATPLGGVPGRIAGYGMPADATGGSLAVGGQAATITTQVTQYPPYTGEAFPSTFLDYTIPAGNPGYADLQITTPIGNGTLPKAVFYAKSVTDYASSDTFSDVLYDARRQQVYLSGTDHIDVFSTVSKQWLTPLKPASMGVHSQFRGLALSVDGNQLLAANFLDNSLGVINPDTPAQTFALPIPAAPSGGTTCATGPFSVSALAGNQAFVTTGLPPGIGGCQRYNTLYRADLQAHTLATLPPTARYYCGGSSIGTTQSTADGGLAVIGIYGSGACLYSTANQTFTVAHTQSANYFGSSLAGDGNLLAIADSFANSDGEMSGSLARPGVLFNTAAAAPPFNNYLQNTLYNPTLNASGSLYFWAYPHWFDIFDVPTGTLRLRFSLAETVQNVETPLAIDAGGRQVFLITDAGLTVIDMGSAPLSIGHLSSNAGTAGAQIQVRGSGFATGLTAMIGSQLAKVTVTDEDTLTLTVPALTSGPQDLTFTNSDGTSYTVVSAIVAP